MVVEESSNDDRRKPASRKVTSGTISPLPKSARAWSFVSAWTSVGAWKGRIECMTQLPLLSQTAALVGMHIDCEEHQRWVFMEVVSRTVPNILKDGDLSVYFCQLRWDPR